MIARAAPMVSLCALAACVGPAPAPIEPVPAAVVVALPPSPRVVTADPARFGLPAALVQGDVALGRVPGGTMRLTLDDVAVAVDRDGRFLIAVDRDARPVGVLVATLATGGTIVSRLAVTPRAWRIERLDRVAKVPVPDADFARRRPAEVAQIEASRARATDATGWRQRFVWPAVGRISGVFGAQRVYRGEPCSYHAGVDVAAPAGTPVVAPADGVVVLAAPAPFTLEGNLVIVDHGHGLNSAFLHLSRIDVAAGQRVAQGDPIGRVGRTGRVSGPHLHWAMKWHAARVDPARVAGVMG